MTKIYINAIFMFQVVVMDEDKPEIDPIDQNLCLDIGTKWYLYSSFSICQETLQEKALHFRDFFIFGWHRLELDI